MGGKQFGFSGVEQTTAKKQAKSEMFLAELEAFVPWHSLISLIALHYPKISTKGGPPPYPLATMLRIHLLQQWSSLSDPVMEEPLLEMPTMRRFAGIALITVSTLVKPRSSLFAICLSSMSRENTFLNRSRPTSALRA